MVDSVVDQGSLMKKKGLEPLCRVESHFISPFEGKCRDILTVQFGLVAKMQVPYFAPQSHSA